MSSRTGFVRTNRVFKRKYSQAFKNLVDRGLKRGDGFEVTELSKCEKRLKLKLPLAFHEYYEIAGKAPINTEHNILYGPSKLKIWKGKLLFMEENQRVVFWGLDMQELDQTDPQVFQAANSEPITWYSEERSFSEFILSMWRWLRGLDIPEAGA
jgi:hypothetical protein